MKIKDLFNEQRAKLKERLYYLSGTKEKDKLINILNIYENLYINYFDFLKENNLGYEEETNIHLYSPDWESIKNIEEEISIAFENAQNENSIQNLKAILEFVFNILKLTLENKYLILFNRYQTKLRFFGLLLIVKGSFENNKEILGFLLNKLNHFIKIDIYFASIKINIKNLELFYDNVYMSYVFILKELINNNVKMGNICESIQEFKKITTINNNKYNYFLNFSSLLILQSFVWNLYRFDKITYILSKKLSECIKLSDRIPENDLIAYIDKIIYTDNFLGIENWELSKNSDDIAKEFIDFLDWLTFGLSIYFTSFKKLYVININKIIFSLYHINLKPILEEHFKEIEKEYSKYQKILKNEINKEQFVRNKDGVIGFFEQLQLKYDYETNKDLIARPVPEDIKEYSRREINTKWKDTITLRNIFINFGNIEYLTKDFNNLSRISFNFEFKKNVYENEYAYYSLGEEFPIEYMDYLINENFLNTLLESHVNIKETDNYLNEFDEILRLRKEKGVNTTIIIIDQNIFYKIANSDKYKIKKQGSANNNFLISFYNDIPVLPLYFNKTFNFTIFSDFSRDVKMIQAKYENDNELDIHIIEISEEQAKSMVEKEPNIYLKDEFGNSISVDIAKAILMNKVTLTPIELLKFELYDKNNLELLKLIDNAH